MLCERGIRTYETYTRNTMDISAIPVLQEAYASAGDGRSVARRRAFATWFLRWRWPRVAAGADGLLMEMHPNPDKAMSDGAQSAVSRNSWRS